MFSCPPVPLTLKNKQSGTSPLCEWESREKKRISVRKREREHVYVLLFMGFCVQKYYNDNGINILGMIQFSLEHNLSSA